MKRGLKLASTSSSLSSAVMRLVDEVTTAGAGSSSSWLDLVSREVGYLMAMCRQEAEDRKEQRDAARAVSDAIRDQETAQ